MALESEFMSEALAMDMFDCREEIKKLYPNWKVMKDHGNIHCTDYSMVDLDLISTIAGH